ncbi:hypothetical protein MesoLj131b_01050 [Mesorhizobium sp. 131-2-5]|uniref:hypothetical protein n=1 Tax=Mesorhizobium sp. 131-2-5 TaxID=2744519 RepID=UPI0019293729|nr:hypothetical protein [Mesorhizobium sp. 131-2-5]BCG98105.1 hypothetical protein MesoLj131b_01050 [Mesorhizobium sp. 131-2-5]
MTFIQRLDTADVNAANDNHDHVPGSLSVLDIISLANDEKKVAELVRRTERTAIVVVFAMAFCILFFPAVCIALAYGI